jgi:hypothetical protein
MKPELGADDSDLSGFPEVGGPFVAVARNPVLEWRSWGQTVRFWERLEVILRANFDGSRILATRPLHLR